jgi:hypothetical protein
MEAGVPGYQDTDLVFPPKTQAIYLIQPRIDANSSVGGEIDKRA